MRRVNKILALSIALMVIFSANSFAAGLDEQPEAGEISEVKITVGYDSFFYGAKLFFEKVRLKNAFTQPGKANVSGIFSKRRFAEALLMAEKDLFDEAQELMIAGVGYMSDATRYASEAVLKKDNGRSRLVMENISDVQAGVLEYLTYIEYEYPDVFDTQQMIDDTKEKIVDATVMWAYISYKDDLLGNQTIRQRALTALNEGGFRLDAVSSATIDILSESGVILTEDEVDAITAATYSLMEESGTVSGVVSDEQGADAVSSATPDTGQTDPVAADGTDVVSSATVTAEPSGGIAPADGGTVDAVSSATPSSGGGSGGIAPSVSYDDDEHEHEDEDDDDDDEHEHDDDD